MKNIFLYQHGGSQNHGCEALVRTTTNIVKKEMDANVTLCSYNTDEDRQYKLDKHVTLVQNNQIIKKFSPTWFIYQLDKRIFKSINLQEKFLVEKICLENAKKSDIAIAIGGDNYCYNKGRQFWPTDRKLKKDGNRLMLLGCSIEPLDLDNEFIDQLSVFDIISVRESISYEALKNSGIKEEKLRLIPDPAFTLKIDKLPLPKEFIEGKTIGINISPMIIGCEENEGATMKNYASLIDHILKNTDNNVALIPHVVWSYNDDRKPLSELYNMFRDTGRVCIIDDHNCSELKGYISRLNMFIGARTHSSIAAYSSCVPTLVIGYSVKAKGIAKDLFGTQEGYVIPVQTLKSQTQLIEAFNNIYDKKDDIRQYLEKIMPKYIESAYSIGGEIKRLID